MQTFLPYPDYKQSAKCLDTKRLGKQRVECLQILKALTIEDYGWQNHPAVKMWKGYEASLVDYSMEIVDEWSIRGYRDTCGYKIMTIAELNNLLSEDLKQPDFLGAYNFHRSHQSNLLRKDPEYYNRFNWDVPVDLEYVWLVTR